GESGVGKSRLLDELRALAQVRGVLVLPGQALSEAKVLYQLWQDALRRLVLIAELDTLEASIFKTLVPDIGALIGYDVPDAPPVSPQAAQERLLNLLEMLFRRQTQPLVIILEDLHWANESLDVLTRLNMLVADHPIMIVASYRDDE